MGGGFVIGPGRLAQLRQLIAEGREARFYWWPEWKTVRAEVLRLDRYECQRCRRKFGRYRRARIVHHVKHLRDRPDLALSIWDESTGERQLESLCKSCHEVEHPESQRRSGIRHEPITAERWD